MLMGSSLGVWPTQPCAATRLGQARPGWASPAWPGQSVAWLRFLPPLGHTTRTIPTPRATTQLGPALHDQGSTMGLQLSQHGSQMSFFLLQDQRWE